MRDNFLEVVAWEYKALRAEIEECYKHSFHIFAWGTSLLLTGVGLILHYLPSKFLFLPMPVAATLAAIWLGQLVRINRAGQYLRFIEAKVNIYLHKTEPRWQPICAEMQQEVQQWEEKLHAKNFGYDFTKPLYWEIWLAAQRGKTPATGHLSWLYVVEASVFPGVFLACPFFYVAVIGAPAYWYGILASISVLVIGLYWKIAKWLGLM